MVEEGGALELVCKHGGGGWNMCEWSRDLGDMRCITYHNAEDEELGCEVPASARVTGSADSCKVSHEWVVNTEDRELL